MVKETAMVYFFYLCFFLFQSTAVSTLGIYRVTLNICYIFKQLCYMKHSAMNPKKKNHISVTETELC